MIGIFFAGHIATAIQKQEFPDHWASHGEL